MFTGIIFETGSITKKEKTAKGTHFSVQTKTILKDKKIGDSISVNGACMTITKITKNEFEFDAMPETTEITTLGTLKKNDTVNLEPSLKFGESLDGHLVQGHIDCIGKVKNIESKTEKTRLEIFFPKEISQFLAFKGSITVNGVSLTISDLQEKSLKIDLIPHTLKVTNLGLLKKDDSVNLEVDIISRYLNRLLDSKEKEAKYAFLKERNLL